MKFSTAWEYEYKMLSNGFGCGFNMPEAILSKKDGEDEKTNSLPPYAKRKAFLVDEYPACPKNWMRSEGKTTSYFVGVKEDRGMWLDFNSNWDKEYNVAIVLSIQGINPITGMPCKDAHLEQYIETCPKCNEKFGPNRFCKKCGYKWPKQNYLCTTGTPSGQLWIDGFRTADGIIRQYIFSQEKMKGVASNIIGENRVFAIGISYFLSKNQKVRRHNVDKIRSSVSSSGDSSSSLSSSPSPSPYTWNKFFYESNTKVKSSIDFCCSKIDNDNDNDNNDYFTGQDTEHIVLCSALSNQSEIAQAQAQLAQTANDPNLTIVMHHAFGRSINTKKMEVAAGARIDQNVGDDPEPLDYWRSEPEAILCINYCLEEDCIKIIDGGRINMQGKKEGFLDGIPVGN